MNMREFFKFVKFKKYNDIVGVEVGVYRGDNAYNILTNLHIKKLFLVDSWKAYDDCDMNQELKEMKRDNQDVMDSHKRYTIDRFKNYDNVVIMEEDSVEAAKKFSDLSLDFVYIDAKHYFNDVIADCTAWYNKVKGGGIIGGHDVNTPLYGDDIKKAVVTLSIHVKRPLWMVLDDWWIVK